MQISNTSKTKSSVPTSRTIVCTQLTGPGGGVPESPVWALRKALASVKELTRNARCALSEISLASQAACAWQADSVLKVSGVRT